MLLTDVKTDEMYYQYLPANLQKNMCHRKIQENTKYQRQKGFDDKKDKNYKRKYRGQQIIKPKKMY